jgi:hypothetical protein
VEFHEMVDFVSKISKLTHNIPLLALGSDSRTSVLVPAWQLVLAKRRPLRSRPASQSAAKDKDYGRFETVTAIGKQHTPRARSTARLALHGAQAN